MLQEGADLPGVAFKAEDAPELPDLLKQKYCRSFVTKHQFAATWIQFDIFVRGIAVGTLLLIGRDSSMGSAPSSDGIFASSAKLPDH